MSQVINTNIMSLTAQNNLNKSQNSLATAMQRLSSGLRINSSADDAAGFAISTRMTTQINGLDTAARNANDAVSLAQTASGALQQITDNLQTIRQLAVQAANATNSDSDRAALDSEVQQRLAEITRVSQQTTFNGRHVLNGSFGTAAFQVGANVGETISINLSQGTGANQIGAVATASSDVSSSFGTAAGLTLAAGDLTVKLGSGAAVNVAVGNYTSAASLVTAINTAATAAGIGGTFASASGNEISFDNSMSSAVTFGGGKAASVLGVASVAAQTTTNGAASSTGLAAAITGAFNAITLATGDFTIGGTSITGTFKNMAELVAAINLQTGTTNVTAVDDGTDHLKLTNGGGASVAIGGTAATTDLGLGASIGAGLNEVSTTTVTNDVSTNKNAVELAAGDLTINGGTNVTGVFSDTASLKSRIDAASITGLTATPNAGELDFTNSSASAVTFGGTLALGLPVSVAAATTTDGSATSTGVNAAVTAAASTNSLTLASSDLSINGTGIVGTFANAQTLADGINAAAIQGVSAYLDDSGKLVVQSNGTASDGTLADGDSILLAGTKASTLGFSATAYKDANSLANADGSGNATNVKTVVGANDTLNRIDAALASVSSIDSQLGAMQNRFNSAISTAQAVSQNLTASRSRIQDADFASETASMSQAQILQQAGISMLAQANAAPQLVLKLLQ